MCEAFLIFPLVPEKIHCKVGQYNFSPYVSRAWMPRVFGLQRFSQFSRLIKVALNAVILPTNREQPKNPPKRKPDIQLHSFVGKLIPHSVTGEESIFYRVGRNRIGRREKWPKKSWEEGEIGGKSREEGEKEKLGVGRIELDGPG